VLADVKFGVDQVREDLLQLRHKCVDPEVQAKVRLDDLPFLVNLINDVIELTDH
jgi:hypothetical protein